jgi:hypothetical protein
MRGLNKIFISLIAFFALGFAVAPALPVSAAANDEVNTVLVRMMAEEDKIFAESSDDPEVFVGQLDDYALSLHTAVEDLDRIDASPGLRQKINDVIAVLDRMANAIDGMADAWAAGDSSAYVAASDDFDKAQSELASAGEAYDEYVANNPLDSGDTLYILWFGLLLLSVVCLVVALIINALTRKQHGTTMRGNKQVSLKDVRRNILVGAGIFVVGAAIPAAQYWWGMTHPNADGSFTYYIFWYPLAIGAILFVASAFQYVVVYAKIKKTGGLAHADNALEMAKVGSEIKIPKIGSKIKK